MVKLSGMGFKLRAMLALLAGTVLVAAIACGGGETATPQVIVQTVVVEKQVPGAPVVQTVIVEKPVTRVEKVVETVIVEKKVAGQPQKIVQTVIVEKPVTRVEKVVETVVVEKERVVVATPTPAPTAPPAMAKRPGGVVRIANRVSQAKNFDLESTGSYVEWRAATHMHAGLVRLNPEMELVPELAESWKYDDDLTVTMKLRKGLVFHNGNSFTADDVKFSLERVALPNADDAVVTAYKSQVSAIEGVDVVDDTTVKIRTAEPFAPLLRYFALPPLSIYDKEWTEQQEPASLKIQENGIGPFTVDSWRPGVKLVLKAFDKYWEWPTAPAADSLVILPIRDSVTRVATLLSGQVDFIVLPDLTQKKQIEQSACCELTPGPVVGAFRGLMFFNDRFPGDNQKIRQAMNYALDRDAIVQKAADGFAKKLSTSIIPETSPYFADPQSYINRDVAKAKQLMAEAGYPDGGVQVKMALALGNPQFSISAAQIFQENMAEIGVEVELVQRERVIITQMEQEGVFSFGSLSASDALGDPDVMIRFHKDNSRNHFKDDINTELVQRGRFTIGFEKRFPIYKELQERIDELAPDIMFAAINNQHAQSNKLKGFRFKPNRQVDWMKYAWVER